MVNIEAEFAKFIRKYNKNYGSSEEYTKRLDIFVSSLIEVEEHNAKNLKWTKSINEFSDITSEEFRNRYYGGHIHRPIFSSKPALNSKLSIDIPSRKDWRDAGIISPVKDQKGCGNCWAMAATEQLESYLALETSSNATTLSVQQTTACLSNPYACGGQGGCAGAIVPIVYEYASLFGVVSEAEYPADDPLDVNCHYSPKNQTPMVYVRGYETLPRNNYDAIINHIANVGPLSVTIFGGPLQNDLKSYGGGYYQCDYDKNIELNHFVQLVGYDTDENGTDYWVLRNSWGEGWGDHGYFKFLREKEVLCGEDTLPEHGSACRGDGQDVQKVCGMCGMLFEASYPIGTSSTRYG